MKGGFGKKNPLKSVPKTKRSTIFGVFSLKSFLARFLSLNVCLFFFSKFVEKSLIWGKGRRQALVQTKAPKGAKASIAMLKMLTGVCDFSSAISQQNLNTLRHNAILQVSNLFVGANIPDGQQG